MMRNFVLQEMSIVSHKERRARRIVFDPKATVIRGENDTGKSSIIKTIYQSFGAELGKVHPRWKSANVCSMVKFEVDGRSYRILRSGRSFSLFDSHDEHIRTVAKVTEGIGPEIARLLDFQLTLADRDGKTITPPPSYLFTPFYIDQDKGWGKSWNSFGIWGQIPNWRKDLVYYYAGIRPNRYYQLRAQGRSLEQERGPVNDRVGVLSNVRSRLESQLSTVTFDIDVKAYKREIDRLLSRCERLKESEESYRRKLVDLDTERIRLEAQKDIVTGTLAEIGADYLYAARELEEDSVACPTCGATYENSFADRFEIARDEDRCVDLLATLRDDLLHVKEEAEKHKASLNTTREVMAEINELLEAKQGDVTLKTLIENEGRRELASQLDSELRELREELTDLNTKLMKIEKESDRFKGKKRGAVTVEKFQKYMRQYLHRLKVENIADSSFKRIDCVIGETGSDLPRAVLAYTFAILRLIKDDGSATFCPILVDSPNQQDQDRKNHVRMLKFLKLERPPDSQLILGLVDDCEVDFGGKVIVLDEKNYALSEDQYPSVALAMRPFEEKGLFSV